MPAIAQPSGDGFRGRGTSPKVIAQGGPRSRPSTGGRLGQQAGQLQNANVPFRLIHKQPLHASVGKAHSAVPATSARPQLPDDSRRQNIGVIGA